MELKLLLLVLAVVVCAVLIVRLIVDHRANRFPWVIYLLGDGRKRLSGHEVAVVLLDSRYFRARTIISWILVGPFRKIPLRRLVNVERRSWQEIVDSYQGANLGEDWRLVQIADAMQESRIRNCCVLTWADARREEWEDILVFLGKIVPFDRTALQEGQEKAQVFTALVLGLCSGRGDSGRSE